MDTHSKNKTLQVELLEIKSMDNTDYMFFRCMTQISLIVRKQANVEGKMNEGSSPFLLNVYCHLSYSGRKMLKKNFNETFKKNYCVIIICICINHLIR